MRISYWSSDVCSSVLAARRARVDDAILIISREMLVADQTIGPEVGDADLEHIGARAHRIGDIDTVRRLPELAQITTVDAHRGDHLHPAEIELDPRSEEHTSELQSLMRISYAVFCLKKKKNK